MKTCGEYRKCGGEKLTAKGVGWFFPAIFFWSCESFTWIANQWKVARWHHVSLVEERAVATRTTEIFPDATVNRLRAGQRAVTVIQEKVLKITRNIWASSENNWSSRYFDIGSRKPVELWCRTSRRGRSICKINYQFFHLQQGMPWTCFSSRKTLSKDLKTSKTTKFKPALKRVEHGKDVSFLEEGLVEAAGV